MKLNPAVGKLALYDVAGTAGVAADISHINTTAEVNPCYLITLHHQPLCAVLSLQMLLFLQGRCMDVVLVEFDH